MYTNTHTALAIFAQQARLGLPVEHQHFGWKFIGCAVLALIFRAIWSYVEKQGGFWLGGVVGAVPMVACLIFIGLAIYSLFCFVVAGEPNSGPPP